MAANQVSIALGSLVLNTDVVIANGLQSSAVILTKGLSLVGIIMPVTFTGTALTFEACATSNGTFLPVYNAAGVISYTVAASRYIAIDPKDFQGIQFLKIKSGSAEGGARTLKIALKGL